MTGTHSKKYKMAVDGIRAYEWYMEFIQEDDARFHGELAHLTEVCGNLGIPTTNRTAEELYDSLGEIVSLESYRTKR